MKTLCDCGQYPIYPGSDECRVCDDNYRLTDEERKEAINRLPKPQAVALAIMCAEEVLPLWANHDIAVRAIQAAKNWLKKPTEENRKAALDAAEAGYDESYDFNHVAVYTTYAAAGAVAVNATSYTYAATSFAISAYPNINEKVDRWLYENTLDKWLCFEELNLG